MEEHRPGDEAELPPHRDPLRFDALIESISPESLLVVIERSMGPALAAACSPEDIWQETLAVAWRDREQHAWTGPRDYRTWLVTLARNRVRDLARTLSREKRGGGERPLLFSGLEFGAVAGLEQLLPAGSTTPSRIVGTRERARLMQEALAALPAELGDVVRLHLFDEQTMEAVAASLSITLDQAWYRFRKGSALYAKRLALLRSQSLQGKQGW